MDTEGRIIIISSVSGGGKTTLINRLLEKESKIKLAVTATSRSPRDGEKNGVDYFFYTSDEFKDKIKKGEFIEHALVHDNYYGIPFSSIMGPLENNESVVLNIDIQGMMTISDQMGRDKVVSIFLMPPDKKVWENRLRSRGSDSEQDIALRLVDGIREMEKSTLYDYCIVNDNLDRALKELIEILKKEKIISV